MTGEPWDGDTGWLVSVNSLPKLQTRPPGLCREWQGRGCGLGDPEDLTPSLPFLSGQPPAAWSPKHVSQVVAIQPTASGPGRSASATTAPTCVAALSCLSSGCCRLLTASQGTSWVGGRAGKSKVGWRSKFKDQCGSEVGGSWVVSRDINKVCKDPSGVKARGHRSQDKTRMQGGL